MAAQNEPASGGMDFWAAIGVAGETEGEPDETTAQSDPAANGAPAAAPGEDASATQTTAQQGQGDWAALFSAWDDAGSGAPPGSSQPAAEQWAAPEPEPEPEPEPAPEPRAEAAPEPAAEPAPEAAPEAAPVTEEPTVSRTGPNRASDTVTFKKPKTPSAPPQEPAPDAEAPAASSGEPAPQAFLNGEPAPATTKAPAAQTTQATQEPQTAQATQTAETTRTGPVQTAETPASAEPPRTAGPARAPQTPPSAEPPAADPDWVAAEQIANSLRPKLPQIWLEVLTRHTNGDAAMASRVYNVLNGSHLLGELMRDEKIDEVHVHGTQVTVCGPDGIRQIPGFPSVAASRRAVKVVAASREKTGIVVSKVNDHVVISRRNGTGPNADGLIAGGVVTEEQANAIRETLAQMRSVTVTGPASRIVVRALASLIPKGSRIFLGAYATLPAGCVTAASPMEADYVLGVRPGAVAEQMAAAGQVGALIANPETQFEAALRFTVTGPSAAPDKLVPR